MRRALLLLGAILIFAFNAHAQINPNYSVPKVVFLQEGTLPASLVASSKISAPENTSPTAFPSADPDSLAANGGQPQRTPTGVFQIYNWRIYAGYSFFRFYVSSKPDITENMNGFDLGMVFYPHSTWFGVEGQFFLEFGSLFGNSSKFALVSGGPRLRWSAPRGAEIWGHALFGYTHFLPQTALGGQDAFAFEVGGGADLGSHRSRFAIRVEGDVVGSRYFGTYQYSPRFAAGIVYKY